MVMSVVLLTIFFLLSVGFYEHDKAVITEQTFLMARSKCMYGEENVSVEKIKALCITSDGVDIWTEDGLVSSKVLSEASARMLLMRSRLSIKDEESYVKCYAPDVLRLMRLGQGIRDSIMKESENNNG